MNLKPQLQLIIIGILFHVLYIFSIFDIYFTSPLVKGMAPFKLDKSLAKRIVLIVGDGLRADTFFRDEPEVLAPFLHDIISTRGSFGVSHTRVPTESRPGHVALIAGFYEDVSAVTKGWSLNPVPFDSVFNQSSYVHSYGSPDILPMFKFGASKPNNVNCSMYDDSEEDFSKDPRLLDLWVYNNLKEALEASEKDIELKQKFQLEKSVIFLHMLGLDTAGHGYRPNSLKYKESLKHLDDIVNKTEQLINNYFKDEHTTFIFTADHGMGNQGSHGDGHPDNTRTPIVAWGAGINTPQSNNGELNFNFNTEVNKFKMIDMEQADIAPLMASLLGINYPMNSVGRLPVDYLNTDLKFKAESKWVNLQQVKAMFDVKNELKQSTELFFKPYKFQHDIDKINIQQLILNGKYEQSIKLCDLIILDILQGLRYLQTYDWLFLRTIITSGYLGWILYCFLFIVENHILSLSTQHSNRNSLLVNSLTVIIGGLLFSLLYLQHSPILYYGYIAFPLLFWNQVLKKVHVLLSSIQNETKGKLLIIICITLLCLELMVFSYFKRESLSLGFISLALWPWVQYNKFKDKNSGLFSLWSFICVVNAIFPQLSAEKEEDLSLIVLGGILILLIGGIAIYFSDELTTSNIFKQPSLPKKLSEIQKADFKNESFKVRKSIAIQMTLVLFSIIQMYSSAVKLMNRDKNENQVLDKFMNKGEVVPPSLHYFGWILLFSSLLYLVFSLNSPKHYQLQLIAIYLAFAPAYIILSISYETLFYSALFITLFLWLKIEDVMQREQLLVDNQEKENTTNLIKNIGLTDLKNSILFLFLINVSFFSTGNMASISSFSLEAVYRLTVKFSPFLMGALLVFKILIPFFLLATTVSILNKLLHLPPFSVFLIAFSLTDIITLNFFFLVKDEGSWLDIGQSISHFSIASSFVLFISLLYIIAFMLTRFAMFPNVLRIKNV